MKLIFFLFCAFSFDTFCNNVSSAESSSSSSSIKPKQPKCCFKNQVYSVCPNNCYENTCYNVRKPPTVCTLDCESKSCRCRKGLYLNENNQCVEKSECKTYAEPEEFSTCLGENEELIGCYDETKAKVCPNKDSPRVVPIQKKSSSPKECILNKCDCEKGYLRNKCGKCVREKDCNKKCSTKPNDQCSGLNEVRVIRYQECKAKLCNPKKCVGDAATVKLNFCDCAKGLYRDDCGRCIPKSECGLPCKCMNPCTNPNQTWQFGNSCMARTCENLIQLPFVLCSNQGNYFCQCNGDEDPTKDLWLNEYNECVPRNECPGYVE